MRILRRAAIALAAVSLVLVGVADTPAFANAAAQDHCQGIVCVGAESVGGHGPDIATATVETMGLVNVAPGTVMYLNYGPNGSIAKRRIPLSYCITETDNASGCTFFVNQVLTPGWVLCGQIVGYVGYPCIYIGNY
jgi:hypothetical protein